MRTREKYFEARCGGQDCFGHDIDYAECDKGCPSGKIIFTLVTSSLENRHIQIKPSKCQFLLWKYHPINIGNGTFEDGEACITNLDCTSGTCSQCPLGFRCGIPIGGSCKEDAECCNEQCHNGKCKCGCEGRITYLLLHKVYSMRMHIYI